MNIIIRILTIISTKMFSAGIGKVTSQYSSSEFFIVEKKGDLDILSISAKQFGERNRWKLAEEITREGSRMFVWVDGWFGTSWPRTVGFEVRETEDTYYVWVDSRYNIKQLIDRGENKRNVELVKKYFSENYNIVPTNLTWEEAAKNVPVK